MNLGRLVQDYGTENEGLAIYLLELSTIDRNQIIPSTWSAGPSLMLEIEKPGRRGERALVRIATCDKNCVFKT